MTFEKHPIESEDMTALFNNAPYTFLFKKREK